MIASLMSMQLIATMDPAHPQPLLAMKRRVDPLGAVHRRLHQREDVGWFDLALLLIEDLVPDILAAYGRGTDDVAHDLRSIILPSALAPPAALVINELVSNVASEIRRDVALSPIQISTRRMGSIGLLNICNECALPASVLSNNFSISSLAMVESLMLQIGGFLAFPQVASGSCVEVSFPQQQLRRKARKN